MEFSLKGCDRAVNDLRAAVSKVRELISEKSDAPLKPETECDILSFD